nr:hypothetical protein [Tanacetum cinerariifolium]
MIPGPASIVQQAKLLKQWDILLGWDGAVKSTQEYMKKVVDDVGEDEDFKSGSWVSVTDYVNANGGIVSGCLRDIKNYLNNGKLDQIVAIIKSCSPIVIGEGDYGKDNTVGVAFILVNVSVFSHKVSMHYLNITIRNVIIVFREDTVLRSESGSG